MSATSLKDKSNAKQLENEIRKYPFALHRRLEVIRMEVIIAF